MGRGSERYHRRFRTRSPELRACVGSSTYPKCGVLYRGARQPQPIAEKVGRVLAAYHLGRPATNQEVSPSGPDVGAAVKSHVNKWHAIAGKRLGWRFRVVPREEWTNRESKRRAVT